MNDENLLKKDDLTPSERRENASKAGKASGEARRKRQQLRKVINEIFSGKYTDTEGIQRTAEEILANKILSVALNTDHRRWFEVIQLLVQLTDSDKSELALENEETKLQAEIDNINNTPKVDLTDIFSLNIDD